MWGKAVQRFNKKYYYMYILEYFYCLIHVTYVSLWMSWTWFLCEPCTCTSNTPAYVLPHFFIFLRCGKNSLFIDIHFNKWSAAISTINNSIILNNLKFRGAWNKDISIINHIGIFEQYALLLIVHVHELVVYILQ